MNKRKFLIVGVAFLLICLGVLLNFKLSSGQQVSHFLTGVFSIKVLVGSLIVVGLLGLLIKFNAWSKVLTFYKLELNGKFILRSKSMNGSYSELNNYQEFKNKLAQFQAEYDFLTYNIDYSSSSINVELRTPQQLSIKQGEDFLERFVDDLNEMVSLLPAEQIFMDLNITGEVRNLMERINFVITNRNNKVGLNKNRYSNGILGKLIYINS